MSRFTIAVALLVLSAGAGRTLGAQGSGAVTGATPDAGARVTASRSPAPPVVIDAVVGRGSRDAAVPAVQAAAPDAPLVSLELREVTLREALRAVAAQSAASLVYDSRVVPLDRRVSLRVAGVPAAEAIRLLLRGTGLEVRAMPGGELVLARGDDTRSPTLDEGRAPMAPALLTGRVSDAESGAAGGTLRCAPSRGKVEGPW